MNTIDITKARFLLGPNRTPIAGPVADDFFAYNFTPTPMAPLELDATEEEFAAALASPTTMSCTDAAGHIFIGTAIITTDNRVVGANHKGQRSVARLTHEGADKVRASLAKSC